MINNTMLIIKTEKRSIGDSIILRTEIEKERSRQYYIKNKTRLLTQHKRWYANNRDKVREQRIQYYAENKEKLFASHRQYCIQNRQRLREWGRQYYAKNKRRILGRQRQYYIRKRARRLLLTT